MTESVGLTSYELSRGKAKMWAIRAGMGSAGSLVMGRTCQQGVSRVHIIQEAGLGYKNDEKKDSLPDLLQCRAPCEFGPFCPLGLTLVHLQHIKRCFVYWIQELWIRPALCFVFFVFSHQVLI